ncbi:hypothetical protein Z948_2960 [Sulfitobacter donghicola DSW-25 = KCTC 12864 = JCM 14565]|nr:hypothetical protein Z948_2960 [Sulfitobacter donghicola DSW-25 = KCTC 12864 = JCM 14565]
MLFPFPLDLFFSCLTHGRVGARWVWITYGCGLQHQDARDRRKIARKRG